MIPGDIDLTENLDFRNTVREKIKQLPSVWREKPESKYTNVIDDMFYNIMDSATTSSSSTMRISYNTSSSTRTIYTNDSSYSITMYNRIYNEFNSYDITDDYDATINNYNFTVTTINNGINSYKVDVYSSLNKKEKYRPDIFGGEEKKELIKPIPWEGKEYKERHRAIPWSTSLKHRLSYDYTYAIPWDEEDECDLLKDSHPICYLNGKSRRFIDEYLNGDDKNDDDNILSYLTNMNHIRVKDAVVY